MNKHIGCISFTFPNGEFSCVSSDLLTLTKQNGIFCRAKLLDCVGTHLVLQQLPLKYTILNTKKINIIFWIQNDPPPPFGLKKKSKFESTVVPKESLKILKSSNKHPMCQCFNLFHWATEETAANKHYNCAKRVLYAKRCY